MSMKDWLAILLGLVLVSPLWAFVVYIWWTS